MESRKFAPGKILESFGENLLDSALNEAIKPQWVSCECHGYTWCGEMQLNNSFVNFNEASFIQDPKIESKVESKISAALFLSCWWLQHEHDSGHSGIIREWVETSTPNGEIVRTAKLTGYRQNQATSKYSFAELDKRTTDDHENESQN